MSDFLQLAREGAGTHHSAPLFVESQKRPGDTGPFGLPVPYSDPRRHWFYEDFRPSAPPDSASLYDISASGTPTETDRAVSGGVRRFALDTTSEAQYVGWDEANVATFKPARLWGVWRLAVSTIGANEAAVWGFTTARPAGISGLDNVSRNIWFRLSASLALTCEADDGTTDTDDQAANDGDGAITLTADTFYWFGIKAYDLSAIEFWLADANGDNGRRVFRASAPLLASTDLLMPCAYVLRSSGTNARYFDADLFYGAGER